MPGKYSSLKSVLEKAPVDHVHQAKVNEEKRKLLYDEEGNAKSLTEADLARIYCKNRDQKELLEAHVKELNLTLEAVSQLMIEEMERRGMDMMRLDDGVSLSIKDDPRASVLDKVAFNAWVRETGQEDLFTVNYMTLSAMVKERLVNGENQPPGIKVYMQQSITRRKAR